MGVGSKWSSTGICFRAIYKIGKIIRSESDVKDLQGDLDKLNEWVVRWQMEFDIDKCRVLTGKILTTSTT